MEIIQESEQKLKRTRKPKEEKPIDAISKPWQKFFLKLEERNNIKISQWKEVHMLGHFRHLFQTYFGKPYVILTKGAPSKCSDIFMIKKVFGSFNTTDPTFVKEYIDWVFECIIKPQNIKFKKIGFLISQDMMSDFITYKKKPIAITRATPVPKEYKEIASSLGFDIDTFSDLAFIKLSLDKGLDKTGNCKTLLLNIECLGFDLEKLKDLK